MPQDDLEKEIQEAAYNGSKQALSEQEKVEFPEVQKVEVQNWPEEKKGVEEVRVTNFSDLKIPAPVVNVAPEPPIVNVEPTDISELLEGVNALNNNVLKLLDKESPEFNYAEFERIAKENKNTYRGGAVGPSKVYNTVLDTTKTAVNPAIKEYQTDYRLRHAIDIIADTYGDTVSVDEKKKDLRKWGRNTAVGTSRATVMTLPTGVLAETLPTEDIALSVSSSSGSDTTQTVTLLEGHTSTGTNLTFSSVNPAAALTGQTAASLGISRTRLTRARLSLPAVGDIYFYETGTTLSSGVPTDTSKVHMMIPAGEIQTQKASTAVSSVDYWIITGAKAGVLSKTSAWAQVRIEIKPWTSTTNSWYPITEWIAVSDASGTISLFGSDEPYLIVPKNYDVRMSAIANTAGIDVTGGMIGYLAVVT